MNKKVTVAGVLLFIASVLAHPEKCVALTSLSSNPELLNHVLQLASVLLLAFGKALHEKPNDSTPDSESKQR